MKTNIPCCGIGGCKAPCPMFIIIREKGWTLAKIRELKQVLRTFSVSHKRG